MIIKDVPLPYNAATLNLQKMISQSSVNRVFIKFSAGGSNPWLNMASSSQIVTIWSLAIGLSRSVASFLPELRSAGAYR
jgi:hypothetical protein